MLNSFLFSENISKADFVLNLHGLHYCLSAYYDHLQWNQVKPISFLLAEMFVPIGSCKCICILVRVLKNKRSRDPLVKTLLHSTTGGQKLKGYLCSSKTSRLPSLLRAEKCHITTTAARKWYYLISIDFEHLLK